PGNTDGHEGGGSASGSGVDAPTPPPADPEAPPAAPPPEVKLPFAPDYSDLIHYGLHPERQFVPHKNQFLQMARGGLATLPLDRFVGLQGAADVPPPGDQPYGQGDPNGTNPLMRGLAYMLQPVADNMQDASQYPMLSHERMQTLMDNPAVGFGTDAGTFGG